MFSIQIKTIFRVLARALLELAEMPAGIGNDAPDVGDFRITVDTPVGSSFAESVFAEIEPESPVAENIFAEPEYRMTASGSVYTREQWNLAGWSDEALISAGHMEVVEVPKLPPPPPAPTGLPPAPPSAPGSTQGYAPSQGVNVMLDADGLPWDERIHSGGRTQTKDARWTKRKNVPEATYNQVLAQLKAGGPPPVPFTPLSASVPPPPVSVPPAPPPPPAAAGTNPINFVALCKLITGNKIDLGKVQRETAAVGVSSLTLLNNPENQHLIPTVYAALDK